MWPEFRNLSGSVDKGNDIVLIFFFSLGFGQVLKHICNTLKIPYAPLLWITGLVLGAIYEHIGDLGDGTYWMTHISAETYLIVFLPPLIFPSGMATDWHVLKNEILQILSLSIPVMIAMSFLAAVTMRYILWYHGDFTFESALLFGAIVHATNPYPIAAELTEAGASRTLSSLLGGESMFNNGTVYVFFYIIIDKISGHTESGGEIVKNIVKLAICGPLIGIAFGIFTAMWLKRIINNPILEVNLTVVAAYFTFYVAEAQCGSNGIVA